MRILIEEVKDGYLLIGHPKKEIIPIKCWAEALYKNGSTPVITWSLPCVFYGTSVELDAVLKKQRQFMKGFVDVCETFVGKELAEAKDWLEELKSKPTKVKPSQTDNNRFPPCQRQPPHP